MIVAARTTEKATSMKEAELGTGLVEEGVGVGVEEGEEG